MGQTAPKPLHSITLHCFLSFKSQTSVPQKTNSVVLSPFSQALSGAGSFNREVPYYALVIELGKLTKQCLLPLQLPIVDFGSWVPYQCNVIYQGN